MDAPSSLFALLRRYVHDLYHGSLVHSTDFLRLFFDTFRETGESLERIVDVWLHRSGLNDDLVRHFGDEDRLLETNSLFKDVMREYGKWKKGSRNVPTESELSSSDQLVILLEKLLELPRVKASTLRSLDSVYGLSNHGSADVQHRWCELVVKHEFVEGLKCVEGFLFNHQAMGIYLYGELVMSTGGKSAKNALRDMGRRVFGEIEAEMDVELAKTVKKMTTA